MCEGRGRGGVTGRVGANRRRPSGSETWRGEERRGVRRAQEREVEAEARGRGGGAGARGLGCGSSIGAGGDDVVAGRARPPVGNQGDLDRRGETGLGPDLGIWFFSNASIKSIDDNVNQP